MNKEALNALLSRRSVLAKDMVEPGPTKEEIDQILAAGHRVPDHGKIGPWRFIIVQGEARAKLGEASAAIYKKANPDATEKLITFEAERFLRAPVILTVIASPVQHKVPEWEQVLSAGACCQNILNAAYALGYGAQWLTEWTAYDADVAALFNLSDKERIAGFIYIGSHSEKPKERVRPSLEERVTFF